jgi:hypothetical protein
MGRVTKKTTVHSITLKHINEKLDHIHKDIDQNTKDISKLKEQVAMGRGGIKVVFWLGAILGAAFTIMKLWAGLK